MQGDCTLPETCPSELCADVFGEFFEQCNPILVSMAGVPLSDYQQFNECCQGFMRRDCSSCVDPACRAQSNGPTIHLPGPGDFRPTHQCGVGTQYVPDDAPVDAKGGSRAEFEFFGHCQDHAGDGVCDDECSTRACGLDGGDCPRVFGCAPRCACCMCLVEGHSEVDCEKQGFDCHCMFGTRGTDPSTIHPLVLQSLTMAALCNHRTRCLWSMPRPRRRYVGAAALRRSRQQRPTLPRCKKSSDGSCMLR